MWWGTLSLWEWLRTRSHRDLPILRIRILKRRTKGNMIVIICTFILDKRAEHHCKYKDPDYHKSEILKLLSTKSPDNELADPGGRIRVEGKQISSSIG